MKRTPLRPRAQLRARKPLRRTKPLPRTASMAATEAQRAAVVGRACIVCGSDRRIDPAHLIPRSLGGCGDPRCTAPLCRECHRSYDRGELDLLPHLEPTWQPQLAHAVGHIGLVGALRRISGTNERQRLMALTVITCSGEPLGRHQTHLRVDTDLLRKQQRWLMENFGEGDDQPESAGLINLCDRLLDIAEGYA